MQRDPRAQPPGDLRARFKAWQKDSITDLNTSTEILDTSAAEEDTRVEWCHANGNDFEHFKDACQIFTNEDWTTPNDHMNYFQVKSLPGLFVYPGLFPVHVQTVLLNKLLHRDLNDLQHTTNLDIHYENTYKTNEASSATRRQSSIFGKAVGQAIQPKDSTVHKSITIKQILNKKLRWVTLGGQYDWTNKIYPDEKPPPFPADIAALLKGCFPEITPEAAILNFYSPGDTLSLHRDVSEQCDTGLISVSIGCDALFLVSNENGSQIETIRLHSGDVVLMSDKSRYAWHAVPQILPDTCPTQLKDWPSLEQDDSYQQWRGWLAGKRINLNVRQMKP